MSSSEGYTLLYEGDDQASSVVSPNNEQCEALCRKRCKKARHYVAWRTTCYIVAGLLSTLLVISFSVVIYSRMDPYLSLHRGRSWSPAIDVLDYELVQIDRLGTYRHSTYAGPPSPEQDEAWDKLVRPSFFRASREEMERAGESTDDAVKIADGGYVTELGVYHELHCIRHLRFYLYRDHYYPNLTSSQQEYLYVHLDHCLESLRKVVMCHGNSALYSFKWHGDNEPRAAVKSNARSVCVKWDSIESWSYSRTLPYNYPLRWSGSPDGLA
ncbi:hypothetical protein F5B22DRAFT_644705 [Xylaria bambusicola]|uniref:uncharacterized protein n=1 Tax=Xylaria bambusicola TaxID=326684 RepID=UPI00200764E6|nr:uncharacterized protein F5B22DRAFT_644705 [Xylaria bambusicola]KAI0518401.1 hypothetical protein F5B22DRAFT_644705 [Xylaria bambusicola]